MPDLGKIGGVALLFTGILSGATAFDPFQATFILNGPLLAQLTGVSFDSVLAIVPTSPPVTGGADAVSSVIEAGFSVGSALGLSTPETTAMSLCFATLVVVSQRAK